MANPRRAATVIPAPSAGTSVAKIGQEPGSPTPVYLLAEDTGALFRFVPADTTTADAVNVIAPSGGTPGRFIRAQGDPHGPDLTAAAAQSLTMAQGTVRVLPTTVTLTENVTATLSVTGAQPGDTIRIVRENTDAYAVAINNGLDDSTIATLAADGTARWIDITYRSDAAGWYQSAAGALL